MLSIFSCVLTCHLYILFNKIFHVFFLFSKYLLFYCWVLKVAYIFEILFFCLLLDMWFADIFSWSVDVLFILSRSCREHSFLILIKSNLLDFFPFMDHAYVKSRNPSLNLDLKIFILCFPTVYKYFIQFL